jgi:hypothetical protein
MRKILAGVAVAVALGLAPVAGAAELKVQPADTVESVLAAQKGKRASLRLRSGQEITGTIAQVTGKLVQVSAVAGREFFDAVVPLEAVEAVLVRTKD